MIVAMEIMFENPVREVKAFIYFFFIFVPYCFDGEIVPEGFFTMVGFLKKGAT